VRQACYLRQTSGGPAQCPGQYHAEYFANRSPSGSPAPGTRDGSWSPAR
jgi:hypothetical protein